MFKTINKIILLMVLGVVSALNASIPNPIGDYIGVTDINDTAVRINFEDNSTNENGFHISGDGIDLDLPANDETANKYVYANLENLDSNKTYIINIWSYNDDGNSSKKSRAFNIHSTFGVSSPTPLTPPASYIGVTDINDTAVRVNFVDNSNNETGFRIFGSDGINVTLPANDETANSNVYTNLTGLICNHTYTIQALAFNASGASLPTDVRAFNIHTTFGVPCDGNHRPVITLIGNQEVNITKGSVYNDAGAIAIDAEDGDITSDINVTSNVDTSVVGTYEVRYNVKDSTGNMAIEVVRTVRVIEHTLLTSISGVITNFTTGDKLSNARVLVNGQETTTNAQGEYNLTNIAIGNRIVVTASKDGYATNSEIASLSNINQTIQDFNIALLPIAFTYELVDPTQEVTIDVPNSPARLQLPANSLVKEDGSLPVGGIRILITPIDPTLDIDIMPGDMLTRNSNNQLVPIESYGAVNIEMFDADNNPINLKEGESATIRIPIFNRGGSIPDSIPLYYFDTTSGLWVEDGQATRNGTYYEGTVTHFTVWNADFLFDNVTIHGCVEDTDGNLISNASIYLEGINYNGQTYAYSDTNGQFNIIAKRDGKALIAARKGLNTSSSKTITPSSDTTLNECLVFGNIVQTQGLVAKLTWGLNPRDLDTHVVQEGGYHIYYGNKGDLNSPIYLAALDVDDTTSFGPEVFTAVAFPAAGVYHYVVHHYAGISTISKSPARVELRVNGTTTTFVPSEDSTAIYWHVFDIIVNDEGNIEIQEINSFSNSL